MARSQKSEEKNSAKEVKESSKKEKKDSKKKEAKEKAPQFSTAVTVINRGEVPKGTTFSNEDVKTLSHPPTKKSEKGLKPTSAKIFSGKIEFKEKIIAGNRNKKLLNYKSIKMLQQLTSDNRLVFVHYENEKNGYFFVLGVSEANHAVAFMNTVKKANINADIRWADEASNSHSDRRDSSATYEYAVTQSTSQRTPEVSKPIVLQGSSPDKKNRNGTKTVNSYICNGSDSDDDNDETIYSRQTPGDSSDHADKVHATAFHGRSTDSGDEIAFDHGPRSFSNKIVTRYIYTGPSDEEDSITGSVLQEKPKHKKSSRPNHQHYILEDDYSASMTPTTSDLSDGDYYSNNGFGILKVRSEKTPLHRKASSSRRSPRQLKSRELPLSEAESKKGGWHCDFVVVTPTKDGGAKVSPDGSVMLYVATRANVRKGSSSSSDEDSTSDGESNFSYTSNSTLTLEGTARNRAINGLEVNYGNGLR
ncbi:unnamed protein product [Mesocestoides corti]|uniref:IRS-type PTB domain-containing protein n=1 Tax=Mesocestoides corti TaxID=53468 RepID=A0A0R3UFU3_MESCO|nr:unnamed protein product [Mesocestoides corti]